MRMNTNPLDPLILILCPVQFCLSVDRSALFLAIHGGIVRCNRYESAIKPHECFKTVLTGRGQQCVPEQRRRALVSRCRQDDKRCGFFSARWMSGAGAIAAAAAAGREINSLMDAASPRRAALSRAVFYYRLRRRVVDFRFSVVALMRSSCNK